MTTRKPRPALSAHHRCIFLTESFSENNVKNGELFSWFFCCLETFFFDVERKSALTPLSSVGGRSDIQNQRLSCCLKTNARIRRCRYPADGLLFELGERRMNCFPWITRGVWRRLLRSEQSTLTLVLHEIKLVILSLHFRLSFT